MYEAGLIPRYLPKVNATFYSRGGVGILNGGMSWEPCMANQTVEFDSCNNHQFTLHTTSCNHPAQCALARFGLDAELFVTARGGTAYREMKMRNVFFYVSIAVSYN